MFKKARILQEVEDYKNNVIDESEVVDAWMEMAEEWLADNAEEYLWRGFEGFEDRSPEQILCDFYLNDQVEDMTKEDFQKFMETDYRA